MVGHSNKLSYVAWFLDQIFGVMIVLLQGTRGLQKRWAAVCPLAGSVYWSTRILSAVKYETRFEYNEIRCRFNSSAPL